MAWLLDTNILSEIRKPRPEPKGVIFVSGTPLDELYVSAVTLAELRFGIDLLSHGSTHRANLSEWLTHTIQPMFNDWLLSLTEDIMFRWRVLMEDGRKSGHTFSQPDLIIAATAPHYGLRLGNQRWRNSRGQMLKDRALWQYLFGLRARHTIQWKWLRGHNGHPIQTEADALAYMEARRQWFELNAAA